MTSMKAQIVLIPHGNPDGGLQTFLVVTISLALLIFAMMRTYRNGDVDLALSWIARQFRRLFGR
ncbi:MAG TPA: hypothetical protein VEC94_10960 [Pseudolabrys sp.]|jgi:multisubunit Na+/H+ antiporter MnhB subunit|nr:hypothetical protein [Pseudolabrys sp.]